MEFERETNQIDKEGNFLFENRREEDTSDAWMKSLEGGDENRVVFSDKAITRRISENT